MMRAEPQAPRPAKFDAYARAQIAAAGDDPQARRRVTSRIAVAVIRCYQREVNARLERLLSRFGEMERGATDPGAIPPLVRTYDDTWKVLGKPCEFFPGDEVGNPNWRACPCAVCATRRACDDTFGTVLKIEDLFDLAAMVSLDVFRGSDPLKSIYFLTESTEAADPSFWERVYAGALRDLNGKAG
jgi:hypothetical protein